MMSIEHRLDQRQKQTLGQHIMLTQKMQQAIQILQLSAAELEQQIQEELESNPVLELVQGEPVPDPAQPATSTDAPDEFEEAFDLDAYARDWEYDRRHREGQDLSRNPDLDERRQYYQDSITREESFSSRLLTQLRMAASDEAMLRIGEYIIGEIDNRGYFTGSITEIAQELGVPLEEVERALRLVQSFEPVGVGARDIVECLLLQIAVEYP
ncbi:MAG: hypothetical protein NTU83_12085, partial [Candidatus Hydrogenedentes bacterium]|nr:hypothetical protein [Candidatus Hydrogenedentota bacterium]